MSVLQHPLLGVCLCSLFGQYTLAEKKPVAVGEPASANYATKQLGTSWRISLDTEIQWRSWKQKWSKVELRILSSWITRTWGDKIACFVSTAFLQAFQQQRSGYRILKRVLRSSMLRHASIHPSFLLTSSPDLKSSSIAQGLLPRLIRLPRTPLSCNLRH